MEALLDRSDDAACVTRGVSRIEAFRLPLRGGARALELRRGGGCKACDGCEAAGSSGILFVVSWGEKLLRVGSVGTDRVKLGSSGLADSPLAFAGEADGRELDAASLPTSCARRFASAISRATPLAPVNAVSSFTFPVGEAALSFFASSPFCARIGCEIFSTWLSFALLEAGIELLELDLDSPGATGLVGRPGSEGGTLRKGDPPRAFGLVAVRFCIEALSGLIVWSDVDELLVEPVIWCRTLTKPSSTDDEIGEGDPIVRESDQGSGSHD